MFPLARGFLERLRAFAGDSGNLAKLALVLSQSLLGGEAAVDPALTILGDRGQLAELIVALRECLFGGMTTVAPAIAILHHRESMFVVWSPMFEVLSGSGGGFGVIRGSLLDGAREDALIDFEDPVHRRL